jgi:hypothetical protein
MANPVETAYNGFEERAAGLKGLVEDDTDKQLALTVQTAYASFEACAEFVLELEDQSHAQLNKKLAAAGKSPYLTRQVDVLLSGKIILEDFPKLLESGVLLAKGKDAEAMKQIGLEIVKTALGIVVMLLGGKTIKDGADAIQALEDLRRTGQAFKFRKKQLKEAAKFRRWCEAITVSGLAWSFAVQRYLCDISGKASASEEEVIDLVIKRTSKCSQRWHKK